MRRIFLSFGVLASTFMLAQENTTESQKFWENLKKHCGKSYEGVVTNGGKEGDGFVGNRLVMQVLSCEEDRVRIPFYVSEDKSRTWIFTKNAEHFIKLKHDHRHQDGSEDKVTQYGGETTNHGFEKLQMFPADKETSERIPYASTNVWWVTLDENTFTYNLRRAERDKSFTVTFDLNKPIKFKEKPWGWKK